VGRSGRECSGQADPGSSAVARRRKLSDIQNLYVYASEDNSKILLVQISNVEHDLVTGRIVRLEQFRTSNVRSLLKAGPLSSKVLNAAMPRWQELEKSLPPGNRIQIGGEYDKTKSGFKSLSLVMVASIFASFLALVFQFNNAINPILVGHRPAGERKPVLD
jgi:multidrug efflux pump